MTLKQSSSPAPTAEGDLQWDTDDNFLAVGNGTTTTVFRPTMPGILWGCTTANNSTDATNDIDFASGFATDSTNVVLMNLASGLTKRLDAAWAVGTNQGGLFSGSIANTTYHCFIIMRPDTGVVDAGFDTSITAANRPVAYTYYRRVWSIVRSGGAILLYTQNGDEGTWNAPISNVSTANPGTSAVTATLTVPLGLVALAKMAVYAGNPGTNGYGLISELSSANTTPSATATNFSFDSSGAFNGATTVTAHTNTSGQVRYRVSASGLSLTVNISTVGWNDTRGRLR